MKNTAKQAIGKLLLVFITTVCACGSFAYASGDEFSPMLASAVTPQIEGYDFETPTIFDDYNDGIVPADRNWEPSGCVSEVVEDEGEKVLEVSFNSKSRSNDTAAMQYPVRMSIRDYLTGDMNYVSFDFKSLGAYDIVISPTKLQHATTGADTTVLISANQWIYPHSGVNPYYYSAIKNVLNVSLSDANTYWQARSFVPDTWYNLMFFIDKTNNIVYVYLDGELISELADSNAESIEALYVNTYSEITNDNTPVFRVDNFKVGKMNVAAPPSFEDDIKISDLNLSKSTGRLTMVFEDNIESDVLLNNLVIFKDSDIVEYTDPTYDSTTYTLGLNISNYDAAYDYKVCINADSDSKYSPCVCELTASGNYISYLYDDYDDETSVYEWNFENASNTEYEEEAGRGKVLGLKLPEKEEQACAVARCDGLNEYLNGNLSFISFDMKAKTTQDMVIAPSNDGRDFQSSLIAAKNGYYVGSNNVTPLAYNDNLKIWFGAADLSAIQGWGYESATAFNENVWCNIKFVFDKISKQVTVYVNNKVVDSRTVSDKYINETDELLIGHFSKAEDSEEPVIFIDNFKVGTFFEPLSVSEVSFVDVTGASHIEGSTVNSFIKQIKLKFTADINESTLRDIGVYFENNEIEYDSVLYDSEEKSCTINISKIPNHGDIVKVCVENVKTLEGLDVDGFEATYTQGSYDNRVKVFGLGYVKADGSAFIQKEPADVYAGGTIINASESTQTVLIVSAEYINGLLSDFKFAGQTIEPMSIFDFDENNKLLKASNLSNSEMCLTVLNGGDIHYPFSEKVIVK